MTALLSFVIVKSVALFALSQAAFYYAFKYIISSMDPLKTKKKDAHEKSAKVLDRLGVSEYQSGHNNKFIFFYFGKYCSIIHVSCSNSG